jgi:hypothetical protein
MKKPKVVKSFSFKDLSHQDMADLVNESHPVNLKYNEDLVNRVYARYSVIDKSKVAIIIKAVFQSFRDLLVLGKVLNFNNLFFDTKLLIFDYRKNGHIFPALKVKISTPPPLRHYDK